MSTAGEDPLVVGSDGMPPANPAQPLPPMPPSQPLPPAPSQPLAPSAPPVAPAADPVMPPQAPVQPIQPVMPPQAPAVPDPGFPAPQAPVQPITPAMPPAAPAGPEPIIPAIPAVPDPGFPAPQAPVQPVEPAAPVMPPVAPPVAPIMPPQAPVAPPVMPEPGFPVPEPLAPAMPPVMPPVSPLDPVAPPAAPITPPAPPYAPIMPEPGFPAPAAPVQPIAPVMPPPLVDIPAAPIMPQPPVEAGDAAPLGQPSAPLVQDVLVAVAAHEGTEGSEDLARNVALSDLRTAAKMQREDGRRTQKNTRKKSSAPKFIRVATRFHPGRPLVAAFASPKGGVAKSTTSANFAAYIAKAAELSGMGDKVRVLLVDGDVANGNMALRLAHTLTPNMLDMVNHMDELAAHNQKMDNWQRDISPFVLAHPKLPNMDILAAPDNPEVITQLRQEDLDGMMRAWAQFYQVVVFDCGTQITEFTNCAWLNYSSQVYLMVEPELACLNSTSEFVKRARKGQLITPDVCRIICVRADMDIGDLNTQQAVGDVFSFIPPQRQFYWPDFHRDAIEAGNSGELLTLDSADYADSLTPVVKGALEVYEQDFNQMR